MEKKIEDILKVLEEKGEWSGVLTGEEHHDVIGGVVERKVTEPTYEHPYFESIKSRKIRNKKEWKYTIKIIEKKYGGKPVEEEEEETEGSGFFPF